MYCLRRFFFFVLRQFSIKVQLRFGTAKPKHNLAFFDHTLQCQKIGGERLSPITTCNPRRIDRPVKTKDDRYVLQL